VNKKFFLLTLILAPAMIFARVSKQDLCNKICCVQATANYLCQFTSSLNVDIIGLKNSVATIESNIDVLDSRVDVLESKVDVLETEMDTAESRLDVLEETVGEPVAETMTIDTAGNYVLQKDFNGCIIIDANDVTLNLNDRTITGNCDPVILVTAGTTGAVIKNGNIIGDSQNNYGIKLEAGADGCTIYDVNINNCDAGITVTGSKEILIENCIIKNCDAYGISFINSGTSEVKYCQVLDIDTTSLFKAFESDAKDGATACNITFYNCIAKNITSTLDVYCFSFPDPVVSYDYIIDNCIIDKITGDNVYAIFSRAERVQVTDNSISNITGTGASGCVGIWCRNSGAEKLYAHNNFLINFSPSTSFGIYVDDDNSTCYISGNFLKEVSGTNDRTIYSEDACSVIGNMSVGNGADPFSGLGTLVDNSLIA